ncbi:MAG TPA: hypothetical protein VFQ45_18630 [Longimicrobium sp.]|nr:hypothetical protein [Longimicrobium sp.]
MTHTFRRAGQVFVLALAALAAGCTDAGGPTAAAPGASLGRVATQSTETELMAPASELYKLARFRTKPQVTIAWAKKWIGPEGGRLDFLGFAIEVPAGAVDKVTMFTIRLPVDPKGSEHVVAEFGPHNQQFRVPVAIELPFTNTTLEGSPTLPTIVWWNDAWVDMGATLTADGRRLRTSTPHFSTYGTADTGRGGSIQVSGG